MSLAGGEQGEGAGLPSVSLAGGGGRGGRGRVAKCELGRGERGGKGQSCQEPALGNEVVARLREGLPSTRN